MASVLKSVRMLLQVCTLSSLLPLTLLGLVPNTTGAEELQRKADEDAAEY